MTKTDDDETCTQCGKAYTDKACGLNHLAIKEKITEKYGDKSWPPKSIETK